MKHLSITGLFLILLASGTTGGMLLDEANEVYNSGDVEKSIGLYKKAALAGENPTLCYFNMANGYFQLDSLPQSIVYYKACLGYAPDFFRGHLNLGIAYFTLDDIGACIASIRRALSLEPGDIKALLILAASYRQAGAYPEAIATFEQIVSLAPEKEKPYIALAEMYRELGDDHEAIKWLLRYPQGTQNDAYVNILLADIYEQQQDLSRALFYLKLSYEQDDSNKWVFYRIVALHKKNGNDLVALEQGLLGLEKRPTFAELALLTGNISFQLGKYDQAERLYLQARNNGSAGAVVGLDNLRIVRKQQRALIESAGL